MRREVKVFFILWAAMLAVMGGALVVQFAQIERLENKVSALEVNTRGAVYLADQVWSPSFEHTNHELKAKLRARADKLNRELNQMIVDGADG